VLCSHGNDFSQPEGLGLLGVAIVGEASGEKEQKDLLPFRPYAPAGMVLERSLRRLGYTRDQFAITNIIRCRPIDNLLDGMYYEQEAIRQCSANLKAFLTKFQPKVVVALGNVAFRTLTGISGEKRTISHMRGYVFRALPEFCEAAGIKDLLVVPTYHPSFIRRGSTHLMGVFCRDIQRAVNIRTGKDKSFILDLPDFAGAEIKWIENPDNNEPFGSPPPEFYQQIAETWLAKYNLRYQLKPNLRDLDIFCRDIKAKSEAYAAQTPDMKAADLLALSWDLETHESDSLDEDASDGYTNTEIRLFQASIQPGTGIAMPWEGNYIHAARFLMKLALPKVGHNSWLFDQKVMRAVGERDFGSRANLQLSGVSHDTMQMFHYWQPDLPAHLQYASSFTQFPFPWKHFNGSNLELYGIADVDAALRLYIVMRKTMEDRQIWFDNENPQRQAAGYLAMVQDVRPILADMEDRGLPVDDERRIALDKDFEEVQTELMVYLDDKFPDEARKLTPKEGYKGMPARVKELLEELRPTMIPEVEGVKPGKAPTKKAIAEASKIAFASRYASLQPDEWELIRSTKFFDPPTKNEEGEEEPGESYFFDQRVFGQQQLDNGLKTEGKTLWCRVYQFSPNSSQQLMNYMRFRGHKVPTKKGGGETTNKTELVRLSSKHGDDFYTKVIECRELGKMRGTYIEGFKPHADGRVHSTFTFDTATMQLSSRNPNTQNAPKHGRLAKAVRSMIRHPGTKQMVEWDFKAYHVLTTGFEAQSANYMRLARLDMHSFVAGHFNKNWNAFNLFSESDEELLAKFKWFKSDDARKVIRDKKAKPSILGIGFGLGVKKLYDMNRESFANLKEAENLMNLIKDLFPEVFRWQNQIRELAHKQQFLRNRFGAIRWLYEVYTPDGRGGWAPGEQSEQAIAFLPASSAFGNIRECMKAMDRKGLLEKWEMVNTVHDSFVFLVEPELMPQHIAEMYPVLNAPSKVLIDPVLAPEGLQVDVECSVGATWADLKEIKIPQEVLASSV